MRETTAAPDWFYAALHRGHPGDVAFYLAQCRGAKEALELGVGYGRIALALAREGVEVTGLELDPALLAQARRAAAGSPPEVRSRLSMLGGDMRRFDLGRRFARVFLPYSGLFCLLDDASVDACFRAVARHLLPGGRFVFDTYQADDLHADPDAMDGETDETPLVELDVQGGRYAVTERVRWARADQRLDTTYVAYRQDTDGGERHVQTIPQRYLTRAQVTRALARACLVPHGVYGGFDGGACCPSSPIRVVVAGLVDDAT
ncbi:MAG: class I SAM-dependent methyltransferase [Myxococcota bacterium]